MSLRDEATGATGATGAGPAVLCVGESMAAMVPDQAGPLEHATHFRRGTGGAESNVACGLAALGVRSAWLSRVGDDGFGRLMLAELGAHGVDTSGVAVDARRPTGLYVKEIGGASGSPHDLGPGNSRLHYYRTDSAASALGPEALATPAAAALLGAAGLVHVTGITAALGRLAGRDNGERLVAALFERRRPGQLISFDLNWRPRLWPDRAAAREVLLALARRADVVLLGSDEAEAVFGTGDAVELRALIAEPMILVVKESALRAVGFDRGDAGGHADCAEDEAVAAPALRVDVVEAVGAGDAFAAGYLAGLLRGYDQRRRLRLGHVCAAHALIVSGDHGTPPSGAALDELLECSDEAWAGTRISVTCENPETTAEARR